MYKGIKKYDGFYNNVKCNNENKEIKTALLKHLNDEPDYIYDLGCGTGLLDRLIGRTYCVIGFDPDPDMKPLHVHGASKAIDYINLWQKDSKDEYAIISSFAMAYFSFAGIIKTLRHRNSQFHVVYNKPWKSSSKSFYGGKRWVFMRTVWFKSVFILLLSKILGYKKSKLMGENHYYILTRGKQND